MSQPEDHPFHLSKLVTPALDGIIRALTDRGRGMTEAQRMAIGDQYLTLIMSFMPHDGIDIVLAGQTVMFSELLADGARDVLCGMVDTMKQRSQSTLVAMGRLTQGHLDRLEKRRDRDVRPTATTARPPNEAPQIETQPAEAPAPEPRPTVAKPTHQSSATPSAPEPAASDPIIVPTRPAETSSWLDEPFEQWLVETPADIAARDLRRTLAADEDAPDPALPRQPGGYKPALQLVGAGAD